MISRNRLNAFESSIYAILSYGGKHSTDFDIFHEVKIIEKLNNILKVKIL